MKRLTNDENDAVHRIFNHVDNKCGNYHGQKTFDEAKGFASRNKWIMFPEKSILSKIEGIIAPYPNIYIYLGDEIIDDGNGKFEGNIGVTYGNEYSIESFKKVLKRNPDDLMVPINSLNWTVSITHKIKTEFGNNTPHYVDLINFDSLTVTAKDIEDAITDSDNRLLRKGEFFDNGDGPEEVIKCVTVLSVSTSTDYDHCDEDITKAFSLFKKIIGLHIKRSDMAERFYKKLKLKPKKKEIHTGIQRLKELESRM